MTEQVLHPIDYVFSPLRLVFWILSVPLRVTSWTVKKVRARTYNPEKDICPGCGFRGDGGTAGKTCRVTFRETDGPDRGNLEHECFRCSALFYTKTIKPVETWHKQSTVRTRAERTKEIMANGKI
jgi:hypothetical protein